MLLKPEDSEVGFLSSLGQRPASQFVRRSRKSHDSPSCSPWEDGVGMGSELWQLHPLSENLPLARPPGPSSQPILPVCPPGPSSWPRGLSISEMLLSQPHRPALALCLGGVVLSLSRTTGSWRRGTRGPGKSCFDGGKMEALKALPEPGSTHPESGPCSPSPPCSPPSAPSLRGKVWDFVSTSPCRGH